MAQKVKLALPEVSDSRKRSWLTKEQRQAFEAVAATDSLAAAARVAKCKPQTIKKRVQQGLENILIMRRQMQL